MSIAKTTRMMIMDDMIFLVLLLNLITNPSAMNITFVHLMTR